MRTALILIDIQNGFSDPIWGKRNNPAFETNVRHLLRQFRIGKHSIIHVQHLSREEHSPLRPNQDGVDFMDFAMPQQFEPVFQKHVHSAFIGTTLEEELRQKGIRHLVLVGFTSDHCVSTTARMGCDLGFEITVISDAVATFDREGVDGRAYPAEQVQSVSLASLNREFASVQTTQEILETNSQEVSL